jgi:signal transduction histidine kinase/CheY-like chemotaxis protein
MGTLSVLFVGGTYVRREALQALLREQGIELRDEHASHPPSSRGAWDAVVCDEEIARPGAVLLADDPSPAMVLRAIAAGAADVVARDDVTRLAAALVREAGRAAEHQVAAAIEERLGNAERLAAVGLLTGGVLHDFNNVAQVLRATVLTLDHDLAALLEPCHAAAEQLAQLREISDQTSHLAAQLLGFSRERGSDPPGPLDMNRAVERVVMLLRRLLPHKVRVVMQLCRAPALVEIHRSQLDQLMMNLVLNARDAMPDGGEVTITTTERTTGHNGTSTRWVVLAVTDTGAGIAADLERIFEPFYSTKPKGTGLGLSTVRSIVRRAGGDVTVASRRGEGTRFEIVLPAAQSAHRVLTPLPPSPPPLARPGSHTVLLVEDDAIVRRSVRRMLQHLGYRTLEADAADAALRVLDEQREAGVDVVLTDQDMPGLTGAELAVRLRATHPRLAVILMSGHVDDAAPPSGLSYLQKPVLPEDLDVAIRGVLVPAPAPPS